MLDYLYLNLYPKGNTMKKFSKIATVALVAGIALTGCSQNTAEPKDSDVKSDARSAFAEFQSTAAENAESVTDILSDVTVKVNTSLNVIDLKKLNSEEPLLERYESLEPENQKNIADIYTDADPVSDFYSYADMSDAEKATAGLLSLLITSFTDQKDSEAAEVIDDADMTIEDANHVTINYKDPDTDQLDTSRNVYMVKEDGKWKISAKKIVEDFDTANASPQE